MANNKYTNYKVCKIKNKQNSHIPPDIFINKGLLM